MTIVPHPTKRPLGFRRRGEATYRIVQLTPPGSECSIQIGEGITHGMPGTYQGLYLITSDIEATRAQLVKRGVDVSEPFHFGPGGQTPGVDIPTAPTLIVSCRSAIRMATDC